jgi:5-methylcytosine-specific restriction protein A
MLEMLLLKTDRSTLAQVTQSKKHATDPKPNIKEGAILLLHQNLNGLSPGEKPIRFAMRYLRCYHDTENESDRLWGRHWKHIIEASECWELAKPFDISDIKVSSKNYGQGVIRYAYVHPADAEIIVKNGYLTKA